MAMGEGGRQKLKRKMVLKQELRLVSRALVAVVLWPVWGLVCCLTLPIPRPIMCAP